MRALVYRGIGKCSREERPKPQILEPGDAIVRVLKTTICGTDLHILRGEIGTATPGRVLGHEGLGVIEEVGAAVSCFKPHERVLISCITACGECDACGRGMYSHCRTGGWLLGNTIDGTQAEYVRIPHADHSLHAVPRGVDTDAVVMLSDVLPTAFECGVVNGAVKPGDTVVIIGAGPVGLAALLTAQFYAPARIVLIDVDESRLAIAEAFGATDTIRGGDGQVAGKVLSLTGGRGADVAIDAAGLATTFELCQDLIAAGGHIANIGFQAKPVVLKLDKLWNQNVTVTTRLVDTVTTPTLLKSVIAGSLHANKLVTHRFRMDEVVRAYDTFGHAAREKALKVVLSAAD
jgi:alcohol dehydrogenase